MKLTPIMNFSKRLVLLKSNLKLQCLEICQCPETYQNHLKICQIDIKNLSGQNKPPFIWLFKGQKKAKLYLRYCHSFVTKKYQNYTNIKKIFFEIKIKSCLALYWSTGLPTFHGLWNCTFWVQWCHSLHTDPLAAFCTKVSPIHSCLYLRSES